jgi:hypothetical protein
MYINSSGKIRSIYLAWREFQFQSNIRLKSLSTIRYVSHHQTRQYHRDSQNESADEPATIVIHIVVTGCSIYASRIPHKP